MSTISEKQLIIIAPTAPPNVCGVSDQAYQIALELNKFYRSVKIGVANINDVKLNNSIPVVLWQQALTQVCQSSESTDVLLNYTSMSYSWSGWSSSLIAALQQFKNANRSNRLFIFTHETWDGNITLRIHHVVRDQFAKWSMNQLGKLANGIAVITDEQKRKLESVTDKSKIRFSRIGANILPATQEAGLQTLRQIGVWVVFGLPHTRLWALQAHLSLLKSLYNQGYLQQLRTVGPTNNVYARQEATLIADSLSPNVLTQLGSLRPVEVSQQLLSAEAALSAQSADSLRKSGTFAAFAAHAVSVICDVPVSLTEPPGSALFRPAEVMADPHILSSVQGKVRRQQMHSWFWSTRSWQAIGEDLREWMH